MFVLRFSVEREASKNIEENERECFKDAIVSSRSLNKGFVEKTQIKNAIPEVRIEKKCLRQQISIFRSTDLKLPIDYISRSRLASSLRLST